MEEKSFVRNCQFLSHSRNCKHFQKPKFQKHVHNSAPLSLFVRQVNPVHTLLPLSLSSTLILSSHLCLGLPSGNFLHVSPPEIHNLKYITHFQENTWNNTNVLSTLDVKESYLSIILTPLIHISYSVIYYFIHTFSHFILVF